jgi:outer membrane receptor for Fe3+-dicitrate
MEHVARISVVYRAPWEFVLATSYTLQKGRWSGAILKQLPAPDPQFGPPTVTLSNGRVVSNPLATPNRFAFETRADGQYQLDGMHVWNVRISKEFPFEGGRRLTLDFDLFNIPNMGRYQAFLSGANHQWSPAFGKGREPQIPRTAQIGVRFTF